MSEKKYVLKLSSEERLELEMLLRRGRCAGWKIQRAHALLAMDSSDLGPGWTDSQIAQAYRCTCRTVENWRKQAVLDEPLKLLERKPMPERLGKLGGEVEPRVVALCCSVPPDSHERWSLRLLADRLVELEIVDSVSYETVRQSLKKTTSNRGAR
jgi:hypothetical protein